MSALGFTLGGRLTVTISTTGPMTERDAVVAAMDPCVPGAPSASPDVTVRLAAALEPLPGDAEWAGDGGDGWSSAVHDGRLRLRHREGGACDIGDRSRLPLEIAADGRMPLWRLTGEVLVPLLQGVSPLRGLAVPHSAAAFDGRGAVLVLGWSESGKTETALALHERGWSMLSDKWTTIDDGGHVSPFPMRAGVRRWTLEYLPGLRERLSRPARVRLAAAGPLARLADGGARRTRSRVAGALAGRTSEALRQAERISLPVSSLRAGRQIPEGGVPVSLVVMLSTTPDTPPRLRGIDPELALRRAVASAHYERLALERMALRGRFGAPPAPREAPAHSPGSVRADAEADLLARALAGTEFVEITCPFPCDPRKIADLVEARR